MELRSMSWLSHFQHWLAVHTGTVNEAGPYYGFWSGFGSDLSELAIVGAIIQIFRVHNCHVHRCWSFRTYPVEGTPYKVCKHHHPAMKQGVISHEDVITAHRLQNEPEKLEQAVAE
jgi:hypothetical protein